MKIKRKALAVAISLATALALSACGGSSSSGGGGGTLKMAGGLGGADGGNGGDGGEVNINLITGGDIILGAGPAPNTSFSPTNLNKAPTELGANPLVVTADMTLTYVAAFGSKPTAGTYYLSGAGGGGYSIRLSDGDVAAFNAAEVVSGLEIARGATLTLSPNNGGITAQVDINHDVIVKGTLASAERSATNMAGLYINPASMLIHRGGVVITAGMQPGQDAGDIDVSADYSLINQGKVLSYGVENTAGTAGDGGYQYIYAGYYFENTGLMDAHGGRSEDNVGGDAGWIDVYASYGDCVNSGDVLAYGGFGELGGGDAGAGAGADGGDADYLDLYSYGGGIYSTANIQGWGGSTLAVDGDGGDGGYIEAYNYEGGHYETSPAVGVNIAGRIDMNGGNAVATGTGNGGDADSTGIYVDVDYSSDEHANGRQDVVLHFSKVDMNGGHGNDGGNGGDIYLYNEEGYNDALDVYLPSGTIDVRWTTLMNGGDVVKTATGNGDGGRGGDFNIESDYYEASALPEAGLVKISGSIEMSGGESLNATSTSSARSGDGWL